MCYIRITNNTIFNKVKLSLLNQCQILTNSRSKQFHGMNTPTPYQKGSSFIEDFEHRTFFITIQHKADKLIVMPPCMAEVVFCSTYI